MVLFMEMKLTKGLTQQIIEDVLAEIDLIAWAISRPANFRYEYFEGGVSFEDWEAIRKTTKRQKALFHLRKQRWIKDWQQGKKMIVRLSRDALVAQVKRHIRGREKRLPKGERCLVMFDFPVGANLARKSLRGFLLSSGFQREQLSVWVSEKDVLLPMQALIRLLGVERWVKVYRAMDV